MPRELRVKGDAADLDTIIKKAVVKGVRRRNTGGKHYVYEIKVTFEDGSERYVYRRFSLFDTLRNNVLEACEGSGVDVDLVPPLPSKLVIGRSHVRKVAEERIAGINCLLKGILELPFSISRGPILSTFLEPNLEDFEDAEKAQVERGDEDDWTSDEDLPSFPLGLDDNALPENERPQCIAKLDFNGNDGFSFQAGEKLYLRRNIGDGWVEGEKTDFTIGPFPKNYVEITIDLPEPETKKSRAPPPSAPPPTRQPPPSAPPPSHSSTASTAPPPPAVQTPSSLLSSSSKKAIPARPPGPKKGAGAPARPSPPKVSTTPTTTTTTTTDAGPVKLPMPLAGAKPSMTSGGGGGMNAAAISMEAQSFRANLKSVSAGTKPKPVASVSKGPIIPKASGGDDGKPEFLKELQRRRSVSSSSLQSKTPTSPQPPSSPDKEDSDNRPAFMKELAARKSATKISGVTPANNSTTSPTKPSVLANKPTVSASKPAVAGAKPSISGNKPTLKSKPTLGSKPSIPSSKPAVAGAKPKVVTSSKPSLNGSKVSVSGGGANKVTGPAIVAMFKGEKKSQLIGDNLVKSPTLSTLLPLAKKMVASPEIVLNYRDDDGDLIAILDEDDMSLFASERKPGSTVLEFEVTLKGDYELYSTSVES